MTQYTIHASSSHGFDSSNVTQYMPNTGMYMGQVPWPQPAYIPPGYAPARPHFPHGGVSRNGTNGTAPPHAPVAPSSGVGPGVPPHAFQAGQNGHYPPATANVLRATCVGPYPPLTAAAPPQQHPSVLPITGSASTSLSVRKKRAGEERVADDRKVKRRKVDAKNPDSETALEIKGFVLVEPVLPPSQVRDITLAEAGGDLDFWRWINDKEDLANPTNYL
ncbi:hypothetical protein F4604DRAFT_1675754 [Suillus subluteus]|nr:hypothetical protein F4604DRAFT_1675754 [Suillus subluteus]